MNETLEPTRSHVRAVGIARTLEQARLQSPFYSRHLAGTPPIDAANAWEALSRLPALTSADWERHRSEIRCGPYPAGVELGFTGGTTGRSKVVALTVEERAARSALLAHGAQPPGEGISLNLYGGKHGAAASSPEGTRTISVPSDTPEQFEQIVRLLTREGTPFDALPRIHSVVGTAYKLRLLTIELLARGVRPRDLGVEALLVFTQVMTATWRRRLEELWEASVDELYGFSEISIGRATRCTECGDYHFPPWVAVEVLGRRDGEFFAAESATGFLAMTAFVPFVQTEPRVRYVPGDVVRLSDTVCPLLQERGYHILGRRKYMGPDDRDSVFFDLAAITDALDEFPWTNRWSMASFATESVLRSASAAVALECGGPRFSVAESTPGHSVLRVESRFAPEIWAEEAERQRAQVAARLPEFDEVVVCAANTLPDPVYV